MDTETVYFRLTTSDGRVAYLMHEINYDSAHIILAQRAKECKAFANRALESLKSENLTGEIVLITYEEYMQGANEIMG